MTEQQQPREHPVNCPWHLPTRPEPTWNTSGVCNACERRAAEH